jgi:hypothetical protein
MNRHRNSAWIFDQFGNREIDATTVDEDGKIVMIEAKAGTGQFPASAGSWLQDKYGFGKMTLIGEGKTEQALLRFLAAKSLVLDIGVDIPPLAVDPPQLANFLISLIPAKHRENLLGDLEYDYCQRFIPRHGLRMANVLYWFHVLYAVLGFLARLLAGIAGIGFIRKAIEIFVHWLIK